MAKYKSYFEKLRDPRWQQKRLQIMERDGFACVLCGSKEKTLNVHHGYYARATDPWDYPHWTLWTLCEECHPKVQEQIERIHYSLGRMHPKVLAKLMGVMEFLDDFGHQYYEAGIHDAPPPRAIAE